MKKMKMKMMRMREVKMIMIQRYVNLSFKKE